MYEEGGRLCIITDPPASYYFCGLPLNLNLTPHAYFLFLRRLLAAKSHPQTPISYFCGDFWSPNLTSIHIIILLQVCISYFCGVFWATNLTPPKGGWNLPTPLSLIKYHFK